VYKFTLNYVWNSSHAEKFDLVHSWVILKWQSKVEGCFHISLRGNWQTFAHILTNRFVNSAAKKRTNDITDMLNYFYAVVWDDVIETVSYALPRRQRFCIKTRLIGPLNQNVRAAVSVNLHAFDKQANGRKIKLALFTTQQLIVNTQQSITKTHATA